MKSDVHVHLERGKYTREWLDEFIGFAVSRGIDEVWFVDHSYLFPEFVPMYSGILGKNDYVDAWFERKAGKRSLDEYREFAGKMRAAELSVKVKFGLEVCYFPGSEELVRRNSGGFDFLVGSVHYVDGFAFDHTAELWDGVDVDEVYRRFFELSVKLAECGVFDGLAHPDSIKLYGHAPTFGLEPYYDRLALALAGSGMYAEQNSGISRRTGAEVGMSAGLLRAMREHGVKVLTASDAHRPEDVGLGETLLGTRRA